MTKCFIYSGYRRSWEFVIDNHRANLGTPNYRVDHDDNFDLNPYNGDEWPYHGNKAGETQPRTTLNQWHNNFIAFWKAPKGYDCYVRLRYDYNLSGQVNFERFELTDNKIYIPKEGDFYAGVNDRFAFGNWQAMRRYYSVYLMANRFFQEGRMFHTESYLKHTLDYYGMEIIRLDITSDIKRW